MTDTATGATTSVPPVMRTANVARTVEDAWTIFTDQIGAWWPLPTHGMFGDRSGGVAFVDGQLVELAVDGERCVWGEVVLWQPPHRLAVAWHPGSEAGPASRVEVTFTADGSGTRIELVHDGWEAFGEQGMRRRRNLVGPNAWGYVLDLMADAAEAHDEEPDLAALVAAYDELFVIAEQGGFREPDDGGWNAEQVIAHVALNDLAMTAVAHAIVHRRTPRFENQTCQEPANLAAVVERCAGLDGLIEFGRRCATQAVETLRRLDAEQRATPVHCRLAHDGHVVLEGERPWGGIAIDTQAAMHLPAHIGQLADLRSPVGG